jgi:hypothetical protein
MTRLLEQAIAQLQKLPDSEQDAIAAIILEELADERAWDESFAKSQQQLGRLAAKVREDIRKGRVRDIGIDELCSPASTQSLQRTELREEADRFEKFGRNV